MKIEMAESLMASWLRHIKECQTVQTNWKASRTWELKNETKLLDLMQRSSESFASYNIYKQSGLSQLIRQAEIDVLGVKLDMEVKPDESQVQVYAIDVAFHESGLNYGSEQETIGRIIKKCLRSAMCIYGYYGLTTGEIIFASPKIHQAMLSAISLCAEQMEAILREVGLDYNIRVIANDDFSNNILQPVLSLLPSIADTGEIFVRSLQMYNMFTKDQPHNIQAKNRSVSKISPELKPVDGNVLDGLAEMKIGLIARTILRTTLEEGKAMPQEVQLMQTLGYSKETFHIQYPLLQKDGQEFDRVRYYANSLTIYDEVYFLCSQWFEVPANNDRPYLLKWLAEHQ